MESGPWDRTPTSGGAAMGRTVPTFQQMLLSEMEALARFRRALRREDREAFDLVFAAARRHAAESTYASHLSPFEAILLSAAVELAKRVAALERIPRGQIKEAEWSPVPRELFPPDPPPPPPGPVTTTDELRYPGTRPG